MAITFFAITTALPVLAQAEPLKYRFATVVENADYAYLLDLSNPDIVICRSVDKSIA